MSIPIDLRELLEDWPYDPDDDVRMALGEDGRQIMQVRLPMGVEQYEVDGRPDGQHPHGMESILEYQSTRLAEARTAGQESSFRLNPEECAELFEEGVLYYYRYVRFFQLKDWVRTARDTARNLRVFDLVRNYAEQEEHRIHLEQWRPYILRMNAMARAMMALEKQEHETALKISQDAIAEVESLPEMDNPTFHFERGRALGALRELVTQIERRRPISEMERLQQELQKAVESEQFERAARLRDRLRELRARPEER